MIHYLKNIENKHNINILSRGITKFSSQQLYPSKNVYKSEREISVPSIFDRRFSNVQFSHNFSHGIIPAFPAPVILVYVIGADSTATILSKWLHLQFSFNDHLMNKIIIMTRHFSRKSSCSSSSNIYIKIMLSRSLFRFNIIKTFFWTGIIARGLDIKKAISIVRISFFLVPFVDFKTNSTF